MHIAHPKAQSSQEQSYIIHTLITSNPYIVLKQFLNIVFFSVIPWTL
jgi:hypothetical protein